MVWTSTTLAVNLSDATVPRVDPPTVHFIVTLVLTTLLNIAVLCSSIFTAVCLAPRPNRKVNPARKLVFNQSVADSLVGLFVVGPVVATQAFYEPTTRLCSVHLLVETYLCNVSVYAILSTSFDRFVAVCLALRYKRIMSSLRIRLLIGATWLLPLGFSVVQAACIGFESFRSQSYVTTSCIVYRYGVPINGKLAISIVSFLMTFALPLVCLTVFYSTILHKLISVARDLSSGVMRQETDICRLVSRVKRGFSRRCLGLNPDNVTTSRSTSVSNKSRSMMRIHVGKPAMLNKTTETKSHMFAHLPSTAQCGFLIMSTSLGTSSRPQQTDQLSIRTDIVSPTSSNSMLDLHTHSLSNRSSLLRPPQWYKSWKTSRRSETDFQQTVQKRRYALRPDGSSYTPVSVSVDLPTVSDIDDISETLYGSKYSGMSHMETPTARPIFRSASQASQIGVSSKLASFNQAKQNLTATKASDDNTKDVYHIRELKAVGLFVLSVGAFAAAWLPLHVVDMLNASQPPDKHAHQLALELAYWVRFIGVALNPVVYGLSSDDLRKAFRRLLNCGRRKQEKKALSRLVLIGMSAARISYGRQIVPTMRKVVNDTGEN